MTTDVEIPEQAAADTGPVILERGRYALVQSDGYLVINRATPLCERCVSCGCGEQQEQIDTSPAGMMKLMAMVGAPSGMAKRLMKFMMGGGGVE